MWKLPQLTNQEEYSQLLCAENQDASVAHAFA